MPVWLVTLIVGIVAGGVASVVMNLYQGVAAPLFGQAPGSGDPATVKAADTASKAATGEPVTQRRRAAAGSAAHYATGVALGIIYAYAVLAWPPAAIGVGAGFGVVTMLLLDDLLVPAMGWGPWPTSLASHAYSLSSHLVFGVVLEGARRIGGALLG